VIAATPATLDPAPHTCTSRRIGVVRHVRDGKEGRAGGGGELRSGKKKGAGVGALGRMHIHSARAISDNGALVGNDGWCTTVAAWMPARGIMERLLATMVSLPASPLSIGQATVIFFNIGFRR
jgi:hypothetical protein